MSYKPSKTPPESQTQALHPVEALRRPESLKRWSYDLIQIIKQQEPSLFDDWILGRGSLTKVDLTRILRKISGCGSLVELRAALDRRTGEIGAPVVHSANYCGQHTICPYCAGRVQDRRGARFRDSILEMARKYPHAYLVTATIPPRPTWREDLGQLIKGWQNFRRMGQPRPIVRKGKVVGYRQGRGEWGRVRAALAKVELKRGAESGLPHCHYHALVFTSSPFDFRVWSEAEKAKPKEEREALFYVPAPDGSGEMVSASKMSFEWYKASGGINIQVDKLRYRPIDKRKKRTYEESIFDQSREVLKYATKFDSAPSNSAMDLFARDFVEIRAATYNRRLFSSYGDFRLVGGSDFEDDTLDLASDPLIFESRWTGLKYSPLLQRSRPIYLRDLETIEKQKQLVTLNRALGLARRMRSAVIGAKNHFLDTGEIRPAFYSRREYRSDGSFSDHPRAIEPPAYLLASPGDPEKWETWIDEVVQRGRDYYAQVREEVLIASLESMDGTVEEKLRAAEFAREMWRKSKEYDEAVIRAFREVLERRKDRETINGPP